MDSHEVYEKEGSNPKKSGLITIFGYTIPQTGKFWKRLAFFSKIGFVGSLAAIIIFQNIIPVFVLALFAILCVVGLMRS